MPEIGDTQPAPETPPTGPAAAPDPEPEKKFTQAEVDRLMGRTRSEAKKATAGELAEQLGCSVDEAKKIIAQHREAEQSAKTEAQREREAAQAEKEEAARLKAEAARERFQAKLERRLVAAGVGSGLDDEAQAKLLARAHRLIDLQPDADDEAIAAEIEQLKADVPGLFTKPAGQAPAPSGVTNGTPPKGGNPPASALERGRQRYRSTRPDPNQQLDPFTSPAIRRVG